MSSSRSLSGRWCLFAVAMILSIVASCFLPSMGRSESKGPGRPILVLVDKGNLFSRYVTEILDAEGLRSYSVTDVSLLSSAKLRNHDIVLLDEVRLSAPQVQILGDWVERGGNLIAMRPTPPLANLLGIRIESASMTEGYMRILPGTALGPGLYTATRMQFHGVAERWQLVPESGAVRLATLHPSSASMQSLVGVSLRSVGAAGGQVAGFAYGLSRSIVQTRQGNPAWAGQERDGFPPIRANDLFYGGASHDKRPDWVDFSRIQVPQADEQQRFLRRLIAHMIEDRKPLPSFWYLPRQLKAAVIMTGDDHAKNGTTARFNQYKALSPRRCSVAAWECVRGTSYVFADTPIENAAALAFHQDGFELSLHVNTKCESATPERLRQALSTQLALWAKHFSSLPSPVTNRNHCIAWSDYASPVLELEKSKIRLDTSYYYWPSKWVQNRPGLFTGSGFPMRFANADGSIIDVYQVATQLTDESEIDYENHIRMLLDNALGSNGFFAVVTANMHTDQGHSAGSDIIIRIAQEKKVPVITARQMLEWLDLRNQASFESINWSEGLLSFQVAGAATPGAGLQAMVPVQFGPRQLAAIQKDGVALNWSRMSVKGVSYAFFSASNGSYSVQYK